MWNRVLVRGWRLTSYVNRIVTDKLIGNDVRCVHHTCCVWNRLNNSRNVIEEEDNSRSDNVKAEAVLGGDGKVGEYWGYRLAGEIIVY